MLRVITFILILVGNTVLLHSQSDLDSYEANVQIEQELIKLESSDSLPPAERLANLDSLANVALIAGDTCLSLTARILTSLPLNSMGKTDSSLAYLLELERVVRENCDAHVYEKYISKLAYTLILLEDYSRVDSIGKNYRPLQNYDRKNIHDHLNLLNNFGEAAFFLGDDAKARSFFREAIDVSEEFGRMDWMSRSLSNTGICYANAGDLDSAYVCFSRATKIGAGFKSADDQIQDVMNLANLAILRSKPREALRLLDSVRNAHDSIENIESRIDISYNLFNVHYKLNNYKEALTYLKNYVEDHEKMLNEKRVTAVTDMLEKYEAEKKARQIEELKVENLNSELSNARLARTRNLYMFGGIGILLMAIGLGNRLFFVRKAKKTIQDERDRSDSLLLNILPLEVAKELKQTGRAKARQVDDVTILFSDFVGFTGISSNMSPTELVTELNEYFTEFDAIMREYGIEKIKTIGDAYMAAGGLTTGKMDSAYSTVLAALKMQEVIRRIEGEKKKLGLPYFKMRVGINTGSVVTGVVGDSKFQFDIWGDAVNVASRMETMGTPGEVNISRRTYEIIKNDPQFALESRGKVETKGKGEIEMYFVRKAEDAVN